MDADKIAALVADLVHPDKPRIRAAVDALIALAADSAELRADLDRILADCAADKRWPIAYILGSLPDPSDTVLGTLLDALDHRQPDIRWAVALLLVRMARSAANLIASIIELSRLGTANQRRMAIYCLRDLNLADAASLEALIDALRDTDPTVRVAAVTSLKERTDNEPVHRKILCGLFLDDPDLRVRNAAAVTLARLGSPSEEFLAALKSAGESGPAQLRKAAAAALAILQKRRSAPADG